MEDDWAVKSSQTVERSLIARNIATVMDDWSVKSIQAAEHSLIAQDFLTDCFVKNDQAAEKN